MKKWKKWGHGQPTGDQWDEPEVPQVWMFLKKKEKKDKDKKLHEGWKRKVSEEGP